MALPPLTFRSEGGVVTPYFNAQDGLDSCKVSTIEKIFYLNDIYFNEQPIKFLEGLSLKRIDPKNFKCFEIADGKLRLFFTSPEEIHLKIYYRDEFIEQDVSPNLQIEGLRALILKKWTLQSFNIKLEETGKCIFGCVKDQCKNFSVLRIESANPEEDHQPTNLESALSFSNLKKKKLVDFDPEAPFFRKVIPGLNFEGTCCQGENLVCFPVGYNDNKTELIEDMCQTVQCLHCDNTRHKTITNCILWDCKVIITGKPEGSKNVLRHDFEAQDEQAVSFIDNPVIKWKELKITVLYSKNQKPLCVIV